MSQLAGIVLGETEGLCWRSEQEPRSEEERCVAGLWLSEAALSFELTGGRITHVNMSGGLAGCYGSDFVGRIDKHDFPAPDGSVVGGKFTAQATRKIHQRYIMGLRTRLEGHFVKSAADGTLALTWIQRRPFKNCTLRVAFTLHAQ